MSDVDHLTDIFMDVSQGAESTTETQEEQRGSWQPSGNSDAEANIRETIAEMRDRYGLRTKLSDEQLVTLVQAFFEGAGDTEIARGIGDASLDKTVTRARLGLHLFRESDTQADFDIEALRDCHEDGCSGAECARQIGIGKSTANRYRRIFEAKAEAEHVAHEYHDRFQQYCRGENIDAEFEPDYFSNDGLADAVADAGADNPQLQ
jgi:hypothetical protein